MTSEIGRPIDLTAVVEAACHAHYETVRAVSELDDPGTTVPWEHLPPMMKHKLTESLMPVIVAAVAPVTVEVLKRLAADLEARVDLIQGDVSPGDPASLLVPGLELVVMELSEAAMEAMGE